MKYLRMFIGLSLILSGGSYFTVNLFDVILPFPRCYLIIFSVSIAALIVANELRVPRVDTRLKEKAMYPMIPEKLRKKKPISGNIIFGKDNRTGDYVVSEPGHHTLIVGSTGSGKTATCLIPSILSCTKGSKMITDIKSRELFLKTCDLSFPDTYVVDLNKQSDYTCTWDILYKLKKDGGDSEKDVLDVFREIAAVVIPKSNGGDAFWSDAARNELIGLALFEFLYANNRDFLGIVKSILNTPLREHMEMALNTVKKDSIVTSFLNSLNSCEDETLFSISITLDQNLFIFLQNDVQELLKESSRGANPSILNKEGATLYVCVDESLLDVGYDRIMAIIMRQCLVELQNRDSFTDYPSTMLFWDEWQKLTESVDEMRRYTSSFLKTARSKNASCILCCQNIDNFKKELIYDIISNIHYLYILSSNNSNSLTSEVATKMAGSYLEKAKNFSSGKGTSTTISFQEKPILKPDELNHLGDDAILIASNEGYFRTNKRGSAYYLTEPFKALVEKRIQQKEIPSA